MEYYFAINKNEIIPFAATWMQLEMIILTEVSQRERQTLCDIPYMWSLKHDNEPIKQKQNHGCRE